MFDAESIRAIADLACARGSLSTPDGGLAVPTPQGFTLHKVPPLEPPLTHVKQRITIHDKESLCAYINDYKTPLSRIFAEPGFLAPDQKARIVAVFDYHKNSAPIPDSDPVDADNGAGLASSGVAPAAPNRTAHIATYTPRYSEAWERWHKACDRPLAQMEFAELIEECRADIVEPFAADLLDMVATFKASKKVEYDSLTYQRDGAVKLHYSDTIEKTGSATIPEKMKLGIPVYYRGQVFEVDVFIRFKVGEGGVKFSLKLDRADRIEDAAFETLTTAVGSTTGVPVHIGRL